MKQDMINSITAALYTLNGIFISGEENVERMRDAFRILQGMKTYLSNLPDEEITNGGE